MAVFFYHQPTMNGTDQALKALELDRRGPWPGVARLLLQRRGCLRSVRCTRPANNPSNGCGRSRGTAGFRATGGSTASARCVEAGLRLSQSRGHIGSRPFALAKRIGIRLAEKASEERDQSARTLKASSYWIHAIGAALPGVARAMNLNDVDTGAGLLSPGAATLDVLAGRGILTAANPITRELPATVSSMRKAMLIPASDSDRESARRALRSVPSTRRLPFRGRNPLAGSCLARRLRLKHLHRARSVSRMAISHHQRGLPRRERHRHVASIPLRFAPCSSRAAPFEVMSAWFTSAPAVALPGGTHTDHIQAAEKRRVSIAWHDRPSALPPQEIDARRTPAEPSACVDSSAARPCS